MVESGMMLDVGCWVLDALLQNRLCERSEAIGCWILDSSTSASSIQHHLSQHLVGNQAHYISKCCHVHKLYNRPFPASRFSSYDSESAHTLHGKYIKDHQGYSRSQVEYRFSILVNGCFHFFFQLQVIFFIADTIKSGHGTHKYFSRG